MYRVGKEEAEAVSRVILSGSYFKVNNIYGETEKAENEMKELFGVKNALVMTSGMAALVSGLTALGIGPGDQVIVPAYTYIATAMAVVAVGAIPVIAECDETLTVDPVDLERKITGATKAVIPVHIQGFPCDMDRICAVAQKHGLKVVEDACQAVGGKYRGRRLGAIGDAGALSFNQYKLISVGEGGALLTRDDKVFERALIYHDSSAVAYFGNQLEGVTEPLFCGSEFRTNEIQAAILNVQLSRMDGIIADLRRSRTALKAALGDALRFAPSHDEAGDLATTLPIVFDSEAEARAFSAALKEKFGITATLPIDTGKHVYRNWTSIMAQRGALHPLMDPFKMAANRGIVPEYRADMCPRTLDLLARTVYIGVNPDWTDGDIAQLAAQLAVAK